MTARIIVPKSPFREPAWDHLSGAIGHACPANADAIPRHRILTCSVYRRGLRMTIRSVVLTPESIGQ